MKKKYFILAVMPFAIAMHANADSCSVNIDSTDAMRFDKDEIVIDKSCKEFTINLTHSGKLAKNVMGHNVVITKEADVSATASDAIAAGLENHYVKPDDARIIAFTEIIGGGEKTSTSFKVDSLKANEKYSFFCSFPGHVTLMKGSVTLK
jgi:azurin